MISIIDIAWHFSLSMEVIWCFPWGAFKVKTLLLDQTDFLIYLKYLKQSAIVLSVTYSEIFFT